MDDRNEVSRTKKLDYNEISKLNTFEKMKTKSNPLIHNTSSKSIQAACRSDVDNGVQSSLAYVTLMTKEQEKGKVIALSYALKKWQSIQDNVDLVVMVTKDISSRSRKTLKKYFNSVIEVELLSGKRTKFHALGLLNYERVLYVSNNVLILGHGLDVLFELPPPAATVSVFKDTKQDYWHGRLCQSDDIQLSLKFSRGVKTSLMLLEPNKTDHARIQSFYDSHTQNQSSPSIKKDSFVSIDSTFITKFYQSKWTHIHNKYTFYPWLNALNYTPICFDMCEYDHVNLIIDQSDCLLVEIVLKKWREMMVEISKQDSSLEKLFLKYEWFQSLK